VTVPLLPIPHNWVSVVEHARTWPTAVLPTRNGDEQRIAQSVTPRETLRYTLTTITAEQAMNTTAPVIAAVTASTSVTRGQVRVPRWEDALPLASAVGASDTVLPLVLVPTDDAGYRRWSNGGDVALWIPGARSVAVVTLAASGAIAADALTLAAGVGADWPAGTRVAPVVTGRLVEGLEWTRLTGDKATATFAITLDTALAGTVTLGSGTAGRAQVPAVASISLSGRLGWGTMLFRSGQQETLVAVCRDAAGVVIPPPPLVWSTTNPSGYQIRVPDAASGVAYVSGGSVVGGLVTVTEPVGGVSASVTVL
jgi:hypothetical protein